MFLVSFGTVICIASACHVWEPLGNRLCLRQGVCTILSSCMVQRGGLAWGSLGR
jgi:hypothetical protein